MEPGQPTGDTPERELFETIKATYALALQAEQHAMIKELRYQLPTIDVSERMALIEDIERAIGQNLAELEFDP